PATGREHHGQVLVRGIRGNGCAAARARVNARSVAASLKTLTLSPQPPNERRGPMRGHASRAFSGNAVPDCARTFGFLPVRLIASNSPVGEGRTEPGLAETDSWTYSRSMRSILLIVLTMLCSGVAAGAEERH